MMRVPLRTMRRRRCERSSYGGDGRRKRGGGQSSEEEWRTGKGRGRGATSRPRRLTQQPRSTLPLLVRVVYLSCIYCVEQQRLLKVKAKVSQRKRRTEDGDAASRRGEEENGDHDDAVDPAYVGSLQEEEQEEEGTGGRVVGWSDLKLDLAAPLARLSRSEIDCDPGSYTRSTPVTPSTNPGNPSDSSFPTRPSHISTSPSTLSHLQDPQRHRQDSQQHLSNPKSRFVPCSLACFPRRFSPSLVVSPLSGEHTLIPSLLDD